MSFSAYGVGIRVAADRRGPVDWVRSRLDALLPGCVEAIEERDVDHVFSVRSAADGSVSLALDGEPIGGNPSLDVALRYLGTRIKLAVAESSTSHVFVHAGVVGIGGGAVVLPAASFQGKTTLVRELILRGAVYYSDDFALLDRQGLVSPFPKTLSVRPDGGELLQVETPVGAFGGVAGQAPLPVDAVLFTRYERDARWRPREITRGEASGERNRSTGRAAVRPCRAARAARR